MPDLGLALGLVATIAILAAAGRRAGLPDPIVFALGGLALALVPGIPRTALPPALVLLVFLPPLIFAAAQDTSWAELRQDARPILLLAVGLVLVSMAAVAVVAHALAPELSWAAAFTLGAIVAPPDAVAAKAIADTLHLPRRLVAILEGEGLVNDATALGVFQIASGLAIAGGAFAPASAALRLGYAAATGIVIGVGVGWMGHHVLSRVGDAAVENTVTLLLPFAAFLPAEQVHASGVLAVLALALYLSRFSVLGPAAASRLQGRVLWDMINFLLTGLSFVLVGLQLRPAVQGLSNRPAGVLTAAVVCLTVVLVRPAWVFGTAWLSDSVQRALAEAVPSPRPRVPVLAVLGWAGMRGVVSLALALSLPHLTASGRPFPGRNLIVFVTFVVVLLTLVGQGLTLPLVIRRLGVGTVAGRAEDQELSAEVRMARAALNHLDAIGGETRAPPDVVERVRGFYAERIERLERRRELRLSDTAEQALEAQLREGTDRLLGRLLEIEHAELQRIRIGTDLDTPVARRIQSRLDGLRLREGR
ncbi:MAG TPA: Na+/H+ antiporter [Gemmatimonadaceae bacterium]|nr:Na+/H+ antiporter [Gemmatimonadaceae bacterium]